MGQRGGAHVQGERPALTAALRLLGQVWSMAQILLVFVANHCLATPGAVKRP